MVCILTPLCWLTVQTVHNPEDITICLPLRRYEISYFYSTYHLLLMGMRLQKRGAGAQHFPSLVPFVSRSTDLVKTTMRREAQEAMGDGEAHEGSPLVWSRP